jgi:tRNA threonylcarbamoyladenosine biosynthesis protein TsaE
LSTASAENHPVPTKSVGTPLLRKEGGFAARSPKDTFELGKSIAKELAAGDLVLLYGELGAGKTLLTKGILSGLDFDVDEVTSPSFALVNLYKTDRFDVYHIDLWRVEGPNAVEAVGLDEILEKHNAITIVEWADRLGETFQTHNSTISIRINGMGDDPRHIGIQQTTA